MSVCRCCSGSPQPPALGLPPLLQRLMSQPGSNMLEDIERQNYPATSSCTRVDVTYSAPVDVARSMNGGASVPKMASPPKTVSAKWSQQPPPAPSTAAGADVESPNTVIKRSLNMTVADRSGGGVDVSLITQTSHASAAAADSSRSQTRQTPGKPSPAASSSSTLVNERRHHQQPQQQQRHAQPQTSTPQDTVAVQHGLRMLRLSSDDGTQQQHVTGSLATDSAEPPQQQRAARPEPLDTNVVLDDSHKAPELVTPQAIIDKASFAFALPALGSSQVHITSRK